MEERFRVLSVAQNTQSVRLSPSNLATDLAHEQEESSAKTPARFRRGRPPIPIGTPPPALRLPPIATIEDVTAPGPFSRSDPVTIEKTPEHGRRETLAAVGDQAFLYFQQRHIRLSANEAEQIIAMGLDATGNDDPHPSEPGKSPPSL